MVHFTPQSSPWDQAEAVLQMRPHPCSAFPDPILLPSQPSPKGAPPTAVNPSGSESLPQTVHSGNLTSQSNSVVKKKNNKKLAAAEIHTYIYKIWTWRWGETESLLAQHPTFHPMACPDHRASISFHPAPLDSAKGCKCSWDQRGRLWSEKSLNQAEEGCPQLWRSSEPREGNVAESSVRVAAKS